MKTKTVFEFGGKNPFREAKAKSFIQVDQDLSKRALFTVTYGLQQTSGLTYAECCTELGACILHLLSCDGIVNNEGE